jgi:hypothetical protein
MLPKRMLDFRFDISKLPKPDQLRALAMRALVFIVAMFLLAAEQITEPLWVRGILVIAAIGFVPLFLGVVFSNRSAN